MTPPRSLRFVALGAGAALAAVVPATALVTALYRFPIPFVGYASGTAALVPSIKAVVFYGTVTGGFVILAFLGGVGGWFTRFLPGPELPARRARWSLGIGAGVAVASVVLLAVLDKIIGPW